MHKLSDAACALQLAQRTYAGRQKMYFDQRKQKMTKFGFTDPERGLYRDVLFSMVAFMSEFVNCFPRTALEQVSQISSIGVFVCRVATYVEPSIIQETCGFVSQLLRTPLSDVLLATFASASFEDLAALCDLALLPSQQVAQLPLIKTTINSHDKLAIVELIEKVASLGPLSGDGVTLALLRLIWGCSSHEEMHDIAPRAKELLIGMGVTKDNFFHVLPKYSNSKPIPADALCFMEDFCVADEDGEVFQVKSWNRVAFSHI